jgi:subtilisin family serine protease
VRARARDAGVVIVAAASNQHDGWSYPAVFDPVLGVGLVDGLDPVGIRYRPGAAVECAAGASGRHVRGMQGRPTRVSGTSFAAPVVTGHVARLLSLYGPIGLTGVRRELHRLYAARP